MVKLSCCIASFFLCLSGFVYGANHSDGMHIQVGDQMLELRPQDVETLQVVAGDAKHVSLMIRVKQTAAKKLTTATQQHMRETVLWIWDGRVLSMQQLTQPLGEDITIYNLTHAEAEDFRKRTHL